MATGTPSLTTGVATQIRLPASCCPEQRTVYWATPSSSWTEMAAVNRLSQTKWAQLAQRTVKIQRWVTCKGKQPVCSFYSWKEDKAFKQACQSVWIPRKPRILSFLSCSGEVFKTLNGQCHFFKPQIGFIVVSYRTRTHTHALLRQLHQWSQTVALCRRGLISLLLY